MSEWELTGGDFEDIWKAWNESRKEPCAGCKGTGLVTGDACHACGGSGIHRRQFAETELYRAIAAEAVQKYQEHLAQCGEKPCLKCRYSKRCEVGNYQSRRAKTCIRYHRYLGQQSGYAKGLLERDKWLNDIQQWLRNHDFETGDDLEPRFIAWLASENLGAAVSTSEILKWLEEHGRQGVYFAKSLRAWLEVKERGKHE